MNVGQETTKQQTSKTKNPNNNQNNPETNKKKKVRKKKRKKVKEKMTDQYCIFTHASIYIYEHTHSTHTYRQGACPQPHPRTPETQHACTTRGVAGRERHTQKSHTPIPTHSHTSHSHANTHRTTANPVLKHSVWVVKQYIIMEFRGAA